MKVFSAMQAHKDGFALPLVYILINLLLAILDTNASADEM